MTPMHVSGFPDDWSITRREQLDHRAFPAPGTVTSADWEVIESAQGATFNSGVFRIHHASSSERSVTILRELYPSEHSFPFAFDWMGRQFAVRTHGEVVIYDPGWADKLVADASLPEFLGSILENEAHDLLRLDMWDIWRRMTEISEIGFNECVGYKRPVFLGGEDVPANLERTWLFAYWEVLAQLAMQVRDLPDGVTVNQLVLERE